MASSPPGPVLADPYRTGAPGRSRRANRPRPSSHRRSRTPRGHWVLVSLVMLVFAGGLMVEGYTRGVLGENSSTEPSPGRHTAAAPAAVTSGGPVIRMAGSRPRSYTMPARTVALTFDDGPDPTWTPKILAVLRHYRWSYGTMQAMWKNRRAVIERGPSGRFGRYCLTYLALFHVLLPLIAPVVDVFSIYGLAFLNPVKVTLFWLTFVLLQALAGGYALRLDGERLRPLWLLPLQQVVYRQLMYLVTIQSVITALIGTRQRWQAISRAGVFADPSA